MLVPGLRRLMSRNPFADRLTFVYDLPQVVGIGLAAQAAADLPGGEEPEGDGPGAAAPGDRGSLKPERGHHEFHRVGGVHVRADVEELDPPGCACPRCTRFPGLP